MDADYAVIVNVAEHSGFITRIDKSKEDWTYQYYTGSHGQVWDEDLTLAEAECSLAGYLVCPNAEAGEYCYSHNNIRR
jgi:hypothetical protein